VNEASKEKNISLVESLGPFAFALNNIVKMCNQKREGVKEENFKD